MLETVIKGSLIKFIDSQVVAVNDDNYEYNLSLINLLDLNKYYKIIDKTSKFLRVEGLENIKISSANIIILDELKFKRDVSHMSELSFNNELTDDGKLRVIYSINYDGKTTGYTDLTQTEIKDLITHLNSLVN